MAESGAPPIIVWSQAVRPHWARRIVELTQGRDSRAADHLATALGDLDATLADSSWRLRGFAPLDRDLMGHRWAMVLGRGDEHEPPNLVLIHGVTATDAVRRGIAALGARAEIPA